MPSTSTGTSSSMDTFTVARQLLSSLLCYWPHAAHEQSPSLLVCGPSGNGKTHLVTQAAQEAAAALARKRAAKASDEPSAAPVTTIVVVMPSLAPALTVRMKDGSTGLRRLLREAVHDELRNATAALVATEVKEKAHGKPKRSEFAVLVALDRLEFFISADGDAAGVVAAGSRGRNGGGEPEAGETEDGGAVSARHPSFVTDLYSILTSTPPLFSAEETAALQLRRLVFSSVFCGEPDDVHPLLREFAFDQVVSLPTPAQAAREAFFAQRLGLLAGTAAAGLSRPSTAADSGSRGAVARLARALAMRTGGISYRGLDELVQLCEGDDSLVKALTHGMTADVAKVNVVEELDADKDAAAIAAAIAHQLVSCFQSSASMAALDYRSNAGYVDVQRTRWDDIAGMQTAKKALQNVLTRPLRYASRYKAAGVQPSKGILLYGPPGTGKTMLAKAAATELNAAFVYLDLPSLVQCEVGESEKKLNSFFSVAKERSPTVMFIDELQAAFGIRYSRSNVSAGGQPSSVHDARLVSHLLQLLDAAQADEEHIIVFIGATNVVSMLDPLLLRAGRLDTHIEVGLPGPDARASLARRVVRGDWSAWWNPLEGTESHAARQLQEALVDAFVRGSDGLSGAELRNATTAFALAVMQKVAAEDTAAVAGALPPTNSSRADSSTGDDPHNGSAGIAFAANTAPTEAAMAEWSHRLLRLLWAPASSPECNVSGGDGVLSDLARDLVRTAFVNGKASGEETWRIG